MNDTNTPGGASAPSHLYQRHELNNMLAQLARQGNDAALAQLWEINRPVMNTMFWRWYDRNREIAQAAGLTFEDFEQEGFFAVKRAAALDGATKERIRAIEDAALRALRQNQELRRFYGEDLLSRAYQGTGFGAWKSGGSVQERIVERQEERERRLAASSTKHLAELLGLDAKELYGFFDDVQQ